MICLGIDPGSRHLGLSVVKDGKFLFVAVASLKKKEKVNDEIERLSEYLHNRFGRFNAVCIERQMKGNMRRIELYLEKAFERFSRAVIIVAPQSIKRYFNFSGVKSYKMRKDLAVQIFLRLCKETGQYDSIFKRVAKAPTKIDDAADASLIAYYGYTESTMLLEKKKKKKKPVNLTEWGKDRMWFVTDVPAVPVSKKRKLS
mgnify:FL=1